MGIQLKLPSYMTHTYKFTTVSLLEYLLFLPYPVHLGRSPNTPTCQPPPSLPLAVASGVRLGWLSRTTFESRAERKSLLWPTSNTTSEWRLQILRTSCGKKMKKVYRRVSMRYPWKPMMCYVKKKKNILFPGKRLVVHGIPPAMFLVTRILTPKEARMLCHFCYHAMWVGWGGVGQ